MEHNRLRHTRMGRELTEFPFYRVIFNEPIDGQYEYYFGSLVAILLRFSKEALGGVTLAKLYKAGMSRNGATLETDTCVIERVSMVRVKHFQKE